jgi:hypothetical protein
MACMQGSLPRCSHRSIDLPGPGRNSAGLAVFRYRTRCGTVYGHTGNFPGYVQFAAATRDGSRAAHHVAQHSRAQRRPPGPPARDAKTAGLPAAPLEVDDPAEARLAFRPAAPGPAPTNRLARRLVYQCWVSTTAAAMASPAAPRQKQLCAGPDPGATRRPQFLRRGSLLRRPPGSRSLAPCRYPKDPRGGHDLALLDDALERGLGAERAPQLPPQSRASASRAARPHGRFLSASSWAGPSRRLVSRRVWDPCRRGWDPRSRRAGAIRATRGDTSFAPREGASRPGSPRGARSWRL